MAQLRADAMNVKQKKVLTLLGFFGLKYCFNEELI